MRQTGVEKVGVAHVSGGLWQVRNGGNEAAAAFHGSVDAGGEGALACACSCGGLREDGACRHDRGPHVNWWRAEAAQVQHPVHKSGRLLFPRPGPKTL